MEVRAIVAECTAICTVCIVPHCPAPCVVTIDKTYTDQQWSGHQDSYCIQDQHSEYFYLNQ